MTTELDTQNIGQTLGFEGVGSVVNKVEEYCSHEERRIMLANEPRILSLKGEIAVLQDVERTLEERLKYVVPPSDFHNRRRKAAYYWTVAVLLTVAAFVFSLLAFDPYRLGWKSYLYCAGIAVVTPFLIEEVIERWNLAGLVKTLATVAGVAAVLSLVFLAVIRGDLLAHEVQSTHHVVTSDDATDAPPPEPQHDFYGKTLVLLRLAMAFLAIAMELGVGLALHRAWRTTELKADDWKALRHDLGDVRRQMVACGTEIATLENEPALFAARFWRNFYHAMLTHTVRNAITKLLVGVLFVTLPFFHGRAAAEEQVTIVATIDLTQSVGGAGPNGRTDFEENVAGIEKLLGHVPVSSRVVVLGITDKSFAQPYILLSARVADDPGYFGERLEAAQRELVARWRHRSRDLEPAFKYTDILGALLIANQIFDESPKTSRKVLVIFSDMRHHTPELDLESGASVPDFESVRARPRAAPLAALHGVEVYALGVDGAGKTVGYWQSLKAFWSHYFESGGAMVRGYSVLRDVPSISGGAGEARAP